MRKQALIGVLALVLLTAGVLVLGTFSNISESTQKVAPSFITGSLSIDGLLEKTEVSFAPDTTALSLLAEVAKEMEFELGTKEYTGMGVLVEKIGDIKNGVDGKYWHYYINGKLAPVGASDYMLQANDGIEWKFAEPDTDY